MNNRVSVKFVVAFIVLAATLLAQPSKIRLGIFDPTVKGGDATFALTMTQELATQCTNMGNYAVVTQRDLMAACAKVHVPFPKGCREERCAIDLGSATGMDRMLILEIDKGDKTYGILASLIDVQMRQVINKVRVQGEPGADAVSVLQAALAKLHGKAGDAQTVKLNDYYGPEVNNQKEWLIATGACIVAGLAYAAANGAFTSAGGDPAWKSEYEDASLSGLATGANGIPLYGRPAAMGNSYLAVSDDAYGVLYNPAGMAWLGGREASFAYQTRYGSISNMALSYVNKATRDIGFGQAFLYNGDNDTAATHKEIYFVNAVAYRFNKWLPGMRPISVGASLRLGTKITPEQTMGTSAQKTFSFGTDLGALWELSDQIRFGLVLRDLLNTDRVNNTVQKYSYSESQPATLNLGGLFKATYTTTLVANGQIPLYPDQVWRMAGGMEQELFRFFKLRLGMQREIQALGDRPWILNGGLGLDVRGAWMGGKSLAFDASYEYNTNAYMPVINLSGRVGF